MKSRFCIFLVLAGFLPLFGMAYERALKQDEEKKKEQKKRRSEEKGDYFEKWLKKDVVYVITEEEKAVFGRLTTLEEKEQFIEQFWHRRDPDLRTAENEFKEEHYRRIAYANDRFASGLAGWMTDRGRIYIIHGPPLEIDRHAGGRYDRPFHEGGGTTSAYPFEIWRYRNIEGIGPDVELEFVDPTMSGQFRLALNPEEKDALLLAPGQGLTLAELWGTAKKRDRPYFGGHKEYINFARAKDNPFERYRTYAHVRRPLDIKYKDLKEIVEVNITFDGLPFVTQQDYFKLNNSQVLVPITLEVQNKELTFRPENGVHVAKLGIYGIVTSLTNRVVSEFEDDVLIFDQPERLQEGPTTRSAYQKILLLDNRLRYRLDLVVRDLTNGKTGFIRQGILPPAYSDKKLSLSSLILSDSIRALEEIPKYEEQMFVLGDVKVHPNLERKFSRENPLGVYLQLYNAALDQTALAPSIRTTYRIMHNGELVAEAIDEQGESVQYFSSERAVLIAHLPVQRIKLGKYQIEVEVEDQIKNESITTAADFQLLASAQPAPNR